MGNPMCEQPNCIRPLIGYRSQRTETVIVRMRNPIYSFLTNYPPTVEPSEPGEERNDQKSVEVGAVSSPPLSTSETPHVSSTPSTLTCLFPSLSIASTVSNEAIEVDSDNSRSSRLSSPYSQGQERVHGIIRERIRQRSDRDQSQTIIPFFFPRAPHPFSSQP